MIRCQICGKGFPQAYVIQRQGVDGKLECVDCCIPDPPPNDGIAALVGAGASRSASTGIRLLGGGFRCMQGEESERTTMENAERPALGGCNAGDRVATPGVRRRLRKKVGRATTSRGPHWQTIVGLRVCTR